jgi:ubiquitin carboxyl-terminal hydrolase 34
MANSLPKAERPTPETSAGYFSDDASLVDRLMKIVLTSLQMPVSAAIAQDSYATILEASLHSRAIWEAFTQHPDVHHVHELLLLSQPSQMIREHIARKIASICGGDLPSTCPIPRAETASRFWTIISAVVSSASCGPIKATIRDSGACIPRQRRVRSQRRTIAFSVNAMGHSHPESRT